MAISVALPRRQHEAVPLKDGCTAHGDRACSDVMQWYEMAIKGRVEQGKQASNQEEGEESTRC